MQQASAPGINRKNSLLFPALRMLWSGMLAVSAVHVRIAFDSPWTMGGDHARGSFQQ